MADIYNKYINIFKFIEHNMCDKWIMEKTIRYYEFLVFKIQMNVIRGLFQQLKHCSKHLFFWYKSVQASNTVQTTFMFSWFSDSVLMKTMSKNLKTRMHNFHTVNIQVNKEELIFPKYYFKQTMKSLAFETIEIEWMQNFRISSESLFTRKTSV